jgi:hypothetical protein
MYHLRVFLCGSSGNRGDCGYQYATSVDYNINNTAFSTFCPVVNNEICGGHGTCDTYIGCICDSGYSE